MGKTLAERIEEAISYIEGLNYEELEPGKHIVNEDFFFNVQKYMSKDPEVAKHEAHKNYVDIQYVVEGTEYIEIAPAANMELMTPYNEEKDVMFFKNPERAAKAVLTAGGYVVVYPEDSHKPGVRVGAESVEVKKIIGKVRV